MTRQFKNGDLVYTDILKPPMEILGLRANGKYLCLVTSEDDITTAEFDGESLEIVESMRRHGLPNAEAQSSAWFFSTGDNPTWGVNLADVVHFETPTDDSGQTGMVIVLRNSQRIHVNTKVDEDQFVLALRRFVSIHH